MSTLIVIPARLGATRLPRKPLRLLGGKPLIVRVWERVSALGVGDRVVVATDSDEVATTLRAAGAEAAMTHAFHPSGTDRVAEVAAQPQYAGYDVIVNVQGDEPYVPAEAVAGAAAFVADGRFPVGTAAAPMPPEALDIPAVVKVVVGTDGRALYFSRAPIPFLRDQGDPVARDTRDASLLRHLGVYAYSRDALAQWVTLPTHPLETVERLEQLRALAAGIGIGVARVASADGGGIDTEEELLEANASWPRPVIRTLSHAGTR